MNISQDAIERLRKDLPTIRIVAGWSAEQLAQELEVSRTTIVNLENKEKKMTKIQYLAIRALLNEEIETEKNETLKETVEILVDREDSPEEVKKELRDRVQNAAKTIGRKAGVAAATAIALPLIGLFLRSIGQMKLNDIPESTIVQGKALVQNTLSEMDPSERTEL